MAKSQFAAQFRTAFHIHEAINAAVSQSSSGLLDPVAVTQHLLQEHPDIDVPASELTVAVARAAADAGVRLANRPQVA